MAEARGRNEAAGLTGLMLRQGASFCGLLEGPRRRVLRRMEEIVSDPRHRGVHVLREEPVESRRFANWSFAALPPPGRSGEPHEDFIRDLARRLR